MSVRLKNWGIVLTIIVSAYSTSAQGNFARNDSRGQNPDSVKQLDILDIISKVFKAYPSSRPDTGKVAPGKLLLSYAPVVGYTLEGGPEASLSVNGSFYTSDQANTSLSVIQTGIIFSMRQQLIVPVISNIWLANNKWDLLGDLRYYKYPSSTYGLGSATSYQIGDIVDYSYVRIYQEILRHFGSGYYLGFGYNFDYHYGLNDPDPVTDFQAYNNWAGSTTSSGVVVHAMYDNRTNPNNPRKSFYVSLIYRYNTTILGSDNNWQYLLFETRKYFSLSKRVVWAFWLYDEFTFGGQAPYFDLPSNGWDTYSNTGRGYVQGRFRGPDFTYGETELRLPITRNGLLGWVAFANLENVTGWPQQTFGRFWPGYGIGLRLKFNKYSDVNICIDYGFGLQNSSGFFFNLGEVF